MFCIDVCMYMCVVDVHVHVHVCCGCACAYVLCGRCACVPACICAFLNVCVRHISILAMIHHMDTGGSKVTSNKI